MSNQGEADQAYQNMQDNREDGNVNENFDFLADNQPPHIPQDPQAPNPPQIPNPPLLRNPPQPPIAMQVPHNPLVAIPSQLALPQNLPDALKLIR